MNDERLIVTGLELPITNPAELHRIAQTCYTEGRKDGAIVELEKIKGEIKEESYSLRCYNDDYYTDNDRVVHLEDIYKIIDNHIKELKGENKS